MPKRTLRFTGSADWVLKFVQDTLLDMDGVQGTVVKHKGQTTSGTLSIEAITSEALDSAVKTVMGHSIFKHHFKSD